MHSILHWHNFSQRMGVRLDLTDEQSEILEVWDGLDVKEKEILLSFIRSLKEREQFNQKGLFFFML